MTKTTGQYDGHVIIPTRPLDIAPGTILELTFTEVSSAESLCPPPGSPAALLLAMQGMPRLEPADIEAFEASIESGKQPINYTGIFDEL